MGKKIKLLFVSIAKGFVLQRSVFDFSPSGRVFDGEKYRLDHCLYPSEEDSFRRDWDKIGGDFRIACDNFSGEYVKR